MPITVEVPESVAGIVGALGDGAIVLAGGTQVMPRINTEAHDVATLVSLRRAGLGAIEVDGLSARVGAGTTLAQLGADERLAFLRPACESIASPTIRNLATVGGNLFVEQPYGDLAVALLALDAQVEIAGAGAPGTAAVADVLAGGLAAGQVVTAVRFELPAAGEFFYAKAMRRRLNSASIVTVAAVVRVSDGTVGSARIALGGAGRAPVRAVAAESALAGQPFDREHVEVAAIAARADAEPFSDAYASAWCRARVLPVHIRRALIGERAAFLEGFATQCGFCASGMIMAAQGLPAANPAPSRADVVRAISGNVCRCTGYEAIINAILDAAARRATVVS